MVVAWEKPSALDANEPESSVVAHCFESLELVLLRLPE
jgi:hypothetical protein